MRKVWVLDSDETSAAELVSALSSRVYDVKVWTDAPRLLAALDEGSPDLIVLEHGLESADPVDILKSLKAAGRRTPVVVVARRTSSQGAIDSMREGAYDYLPRETLPAGLEDAVRRALSADGGLIRTVGSPGPGDVADLGAIIGRTPEMVEIHKLIGQVAATDAAVLIHGESGTGKELIARAIHYNSNRRERPFTAVNCAALPGDSLETELFGGGTPETPGRFEAARDGTMFLDEISESSLPVQGRILTIMEDGFYEHPRTRARSRVDVRVIAATGESLVSRMKEDLFRVDLFYRLKVVSVYIPPLRDRRDDIPLLAQHFLNKVTADMDRRPTGFSDAAMELLINYDWPGNVRELENEIERAVALSEPGAGITARILSDRIRSVQVVFRPPRPGDRTSLKDMIQDVEKRVIHQVLNENKWNKSRTAQALGLSRQGLLKKIARLGLVPDEE